jgi:hypothetical protein
MPYTENSLSLFTSDIAPTAWLQIAHLAQETYLALLSRLRTLANSSFVMGPRRGDR